MYCGEYGRLPRGRCGSKMLQETKKIHIGIVLFRKKNVNYHTKRIGCPKCNAREAENMAFNFLKANAGQ